MLNFTGRDAEFMAAGPLGEPPEEDRAELVYDDPVMVVHRGRVSKAKVGGFCLFVRHGACFAVTFGSFNLQGSYWLPIDEEGLTWIRGHRIDENSELHASMLAAAAMEGST